MDPDRRQRRWEAGSGRDHISGLQDELLHDILHRLRSAAAAARTSVLSRRWRRVWTSLPELILGYDLIHHGPKFLGAVDDALAAYSASHVHRLEITVPEDASAYRVASWLDFASRRLSGVLRLNVSLPVPDRDPSCQSELWSQMALRDGEELELPLCEHATGIYLRFLGVRFLLRLPPAGTFAALADLEITLASVEGRALEALVSTQCPRLRKLRLWGLKLVPVSGISLRSGTLQHLEFHVRETRRLHVSAPALQVLHVQSKADDVYVAAPRLAEVVWGAECSHFVFPDAGSHLRLLQIKQRDAMASLMRRFSSVDELRLDLHLQLHLLIGGGGGDGFKRFLDDSNYNLPKCQALYLSSGDNGHAFALTVLHLLRRGKGIRKLYVSYGAFGSTDSLFPLQESSMTDNNVLDSLEEIEITLLTGSANELVEFLKHLIFKIWINTKRTSVETNIIVSNRSLISEVCKKIHDMCPSNIRIKSNVSQGEGRARFETSPI